MLWAERDIVSIVCEDSLTNNIVYYQGWPRRLYFTRGFETTKILIFSYTTLEDFHYFLAFKTSK